MNANVASINRSRAGGALTPQPCAVLVADLVDSTSYIQRFGDERAAVALRRFDLQVRELLDFTGGRLIDRTDGLLAVFERPIQAVDFALRYQQALRLFSASEAVHLAARVGVHVGEVVTWSNSREAVAAGAKPLEMEGPARLVAAGLMSMALPGQILVSSTAQSLAQRAQAELGERAERIRWLLHGRYRFKALAPPLRVYEVGEPGFAPFRAPPSGQKAWRELPIWRRPQAIALTLLLLLAVGGIYAFGELRNPPALAFHERDWVVIGDMSNFTGDPGLEDSLRTAMRTGLEQSRYVNIVPDLKVRAALDRMGRGQQTSIDRAIGSEIALREGARALLLPSIAEVGGMLRVSLEVVDPNTQVTVHEQFAEGRGAGSVLASLDTANRRIREKLGEAVADITASDKPLPQVTTGNLDALRAYALAERFWGERVPEAMALYQEAIRLDPAFAMAHLSLARVRLAMGDDAGYYAGLAKANTLRARLSHRETLLLDGNLSMHAPVAKSLGAWRLFSDLYPDEFSAYYQYALSSWQHGHDLAGAQEFLRPALDARNPRRRAAFYLQGVLLLAQDRHAEALASFEQYESLGGQGYRQHHADALAAQRRFAEAQEMLGRQKPANVPNMDFSSQIDSVIFPLDQGQWRLGMATMEQLLPVAGRINAETARRTRLMQISLRAFAPDSKLPQDVRSFVSGDEGALARPSLLARLNEVYSLLGAGLIATENGDVATGRRALELASAQAATAGFPSLDNAKAMLEAALLVRNGEPARAIALLRPFHQGDELYLSHAVLMRAYAAAGLFADAAAEADWLAAHRGLAYGEFNVDQVMNPANVVQSNLALLSSAEYLLAAGEPDQARLRLARFLRVWPEAGKLDFLRGRLTRLESKLAARPSQAAPVSATIQPAEARATP